MANEVCWRPALTCCDSGNFRSERFNCADQANHAEMGFVHNTVTARRPAMRHCNQGRFRQQLSFLQQQFLQDGNLSFSGFLSSEVIEQALQHCKLVGSIEFYAASDAECVSEPSVKFRPLVPS